MTGGREVVDIMMGERRREAGITAFDISVVRMSPGMARNEDLVRSRLAIYGVHPRAPRWKWERVE